MYSDQELKEAALNTVDRIAKAKTSDEAERLDLRFQALWRILDRRQRNNPANQK
jgi:hypothetical protein